MEEPNPRYVAELEATLERLLAPTDPIRLGLVVRILTRHSALPWDESDAHCRAILGPLTRGIAAAMATVARTGIVSGRPNEVGNKIEDPVKFALERQGFRALVPDTAKGRRQYAGYPDILLELEGHPPAYLEVKTYNANNATTTQRSFYLSPPLAKVSRDAYHLLVGFEIEQRQGLYFPTGYKVVSIENLPLEIKHEFNASNSVVYTACPLIAEGRLEGP